MALAARSVRTACLLLQRQALLKSLVVTTARPLSVTAVRLVDRPPIDEFTRKKSEYRLPGMTDDMVRERSILKIPFIICAVYFCYHFFLLITYWQFYG